MNVPKGKVPVPVPPQMSDEEAKEFEKKLRRDSESWALLLKDRKGSGSSESWLSYRAPGVRSRAKKAAEKFTSMLLPEKNSGSRKKT